MLQNHCWNLLSDWFLALPYDNRDWQLVVNMVDLKLVNLQRKRNWKTKEANLNLRIDRLFEDHLYIHYDLNN